MSETSGSGRRALVTGGAGFIGSHLVRGLLQRGWKVRVLDDLSSGDEARLSGCRDRIDFTQADVRDRAAVRSTAEGVDVIFHEAAIASVERSLREPQLANEVNIGGTVQVLEAARHAHVRRVIFASSAAVYGDEPTLPKRESMPPACVSPYALQKYASEVYLAIYRRVRSLETVVLRYFNVYGPGQDPASDYAAAIPIFCETMRAGDPVRIFGDGEQTRDFVYVDDVVRANCLAAETPAADGAVVNVASGRRTSVRELVRAVGRCVGIDPRVCYEAPRAGEVRHSCADVGLARERMGFEARVTLETGLAHTADAFARAAPKTPRTARREPGVRT